MTTFNTFNQNMILNADSYKASHFLQYPQGTTNMSSYVESRGGVFNETVFFGLQMFLKDYLSKPISQADIDEATAFYSAHGVPFNKAGWQYILDTYQGYLPIEIQAIEEGTVITTKNALVQVVNTDDNCAWLTSYIETALLRAVWYPTTVATVSYQCKKVIKRFLEETADSSEGLAFKLHDFGARGTSSEESAAIGGVSHLVNFMGTDTISGILAASRYYNEPMAGFSIPAAEHSTITSWGRDGELAAYDNMIEQFSGKDKIVAIVADSYDLFNAIENMFGDELRGKIERQGGTVVIRPDSGDPVEIVTKTVEKLMDKFGYEINSKGYRILPSYIRVIQGDGVNICTIEAILDAMKQRKQSADNVAFGMGAELLQKVNRDTQRFAMKASAAKVGGIWRDVFKDPITDQGKRSKRGILAVIKEADGFKTIQRNDLNGREDLLKTVFRNGQLIGEIDFKTVRKNAAV